ncbi:MAG: hypothetical protein IMZ61_12755 [Planctomycetes bacterium]|nr:hypothetical protein [Planctomycetota bacterium]
MIAKNELTQMIDEVVKMKMDIVDEYIDEVVAAIGEIGSPEKLIGKKYEDWAPADLQTLAGIYGPGDETALGKLIFTKEYEKVKLLERTV